MISDRIQSVNFASHTSDEIRSLAVKRITNPETYDQLLHPNYYGLYDPALGAVNKDDRCDTCGMNFMRCPGHFGYIQLPLPVYHPMFFKLMLQILKGSCFKCHRLIAKKSRGKLFIRQCQLLDQGYLVEAANLSDLYYSFTSQASSGIATVQNLQQLVCEKIDEHYENVLKNTDQSETTLEFTKNLIKCKQDLVKDFIKIHLSQKSKECPHCRSPLREVRSEYNSKIYLKSISQRIIKRVVTKKLNGIKKEVLNIKKEIPEEEENVEGEEDEAAVPSSQGNLFENLDEDDDEFNDNETDTKSKKKLSDQEYITPEEVKNHMIKLWEVDLVLLKCLLGSYNGPERRKKVTTPEIFFLDVVAVPPSRFRPQSFMGEKRFENPQTANLQKVLWHCRLVEELIGRVKGPEDEGSDYVPVVLSTTQSFQKRGDGAVSVPGSSSKEQLQNAWIELQQDINMVMDCTLNKLVRDGTPGIRQLLEKKEGLFRKHMMGKRVDYACRSVISPDPYINTDEIGVPEVFASKLTYCQPVTKWNISQLTQMVINGPNKYPGAVMVELENGHKKILTKNAKERNAVARQLLSSSVAKESFRGKLTQGKKVYRHLLNGDIMLLNRQPTLHRPSIMAHKAKVLPKERTLRLHYANCKSYNADFDGDEMNAHFPQSELGRSEAYNLVSTNYNYLSPKDGKPLAGLIQDHIVSGVLMTSRDRFFNREEYQQLLFSALIDIPGRVKLLSPCLMKPVELWSGKQVVSSIILNTIPKDRVPLNMVGNKAKLSDDSWPKKKKARKRRGKNGYHTSYANDPLLTEAQVIIREGQLMTGILDKTQYGAAPFGLIHYVHELYSGKTSGLLLSAFARLFTTFLQHIGFTLGVEDILVLTPAENKRLEVIQNGRQCGDESALQALNLGEDDIEKLKDRLQEAHLTKQGIELKQLDLSMKSRTDSINNQVNTVCMKGLLKKFPDNCLQLIVQSGAKGSSVNCMQISCLLGQIELEGRRPPLTISGRSLPSFMPYDTSPRAGGFVDGRFLTGIKPQEYFFHCMAGREGLVDTAVKTSRSGYLQRCLIKHLEALYVQYDMTVRDGDGSVMQFLYGEDGVDVLKSQYLHENQFKGILQNYQAFKSLLKPQEVSATVDCRKAPKHQRKCERWKRRHGKPFSLPYFHGRKSPFQLYEKGNRHNIEKKHPETERKMGRRKADEKLLKKWAEGNGPTKEDYLKQCLPCPDPVQSIINPSCAFGAVSEKFYDDVQLFIDKNPEMFFNDDEDEDQTSKCKISSGTFLPLMLIKYLRSMVEPGEAVGLLAGQSIGEPSTQMTLNTFHFAGRGEMNVTLGIPRLREILMTASEAIKTPQMEVLVKRGKEEQAIGISKSMNKLNLMQVLKHISVHESLKKSSFQSFGRCREFRVRLEFLPPNTYVDDYYVTPEKLMEYIETTFIKRITVTVAKIIRTKEKQVVVQSQPSDLPITRTNQGDETEELRVPPDEADDEADISEDEGGDGDATNSKEKSRQTQFTSYDNPDDQQEEATGGEQQLDEQYMANARVKGEPIEYGDQWYAEVTFNENGSENNEVNLIKVKKELGELPKTPEDLRVQNVLRRDRHITSYLVDVENQWCEFTLQFPIAGSKIMLVSVIEKLAEKSVVHESPGITRSMLSECKGLNEVGTTKLKTEGVNIQELWKYPDVLDHNSIYCNNIHAVAKIYGIEAARRVIIKEIEDVFQVYGIPVDDRHLSLIGDYMTFEGVYKPFNRIGIESNPFPFQKMSFETSTHFLRSATAFGQPDDLGSPSSRIVVGRVIGTGTGMCDLLPKITV